MPDEPRRIVIEKSSTVRRRYQRSNKQFRFTAAELKRIEREEELDRRAKSLREKEKKRIANKKKREEQERERKRLGLPDPNAAKVPSSQPLLSNFLGLTRPPPPAPELQPVQEQTDADVDSAGGDTEVDSDGPDDLDDELENDLSCLQEAGIPEEVDENGAIRDDTDGDTDPFDDLDEELERHLAGLQDAGIPEDNRVHEITNDANNETLALSYERDDDEFSDCSAFDDQDILKAAETVVASPSIPPGIRNRPPSNPAVILQTPSSECPKPMTTPTPSAGDSFRDDTADYLEEVFARGCGDSFGVIF